MLKKLKKLIALDNPIRLFYHKMRAIIANIVYGFPSKDMIIIWVTWTNWKTTTSNIITKWLQEAWKKVFMFSTVNYTILDKTYTNNTKMTSPDVFLLQKLLKQAKKKWCEIAVIETASHWLKMHRVWGINYDIAVLTNITQDHLDLHKTMEDYVNTKLKLFKLLSTTKKKPWVKKTAIINLESDYKDVFLKENYEKLYTYWESPMAKIRLTWVENDIKSTKFNLEIYDTELEIETKLRWKFNIYNIMAAIWVLVSLWVEHKKIKSIIKKIDLVPWRLEEVENKRWIKIFVDYAHTHDALEKVLSTLKEIEWVNRIITVFWACWDRDATKRHIMWEVVSNLSDIVILTQDDDYTEKTTDIINDVKPWIKNKKEWKNYFIIEDRKQALVKGLEIAEKNDILLVAWKWDEHVLITNDWPINWNDKDEILKLLEK